MWAAAIAVRVAGKVVVGVGGSRRWRVHAYLHPINPLHIHRGLAITHTRVPISIHTAWLVSVPVRRGVCGRVHGKGERVQGPVQVRDQAVDRLGSLGVGSVLASNKEGTGKVIGVSCDLLRCKKDP